MSLNLLSRFKGLLIYSATAGYFGYVVLGPLNWKLHRYMYTGKPFKSLQDAIDNLKKGQVATFGKKVYKEFFFPSFHRYRKIYEFHTLCAGCWLLTGVFNLRNQPQFVGRQSTAGWYHRRLSGYVYAATSFVTGITASLMSLKSDSLGIARYNMAGYGLWMAYTLVVAMKHILSGDIVLHKRWMIRNFSSGAGSIFVRLFAAVWAMFDLSFMSDVDTYRRMNNIVLVAGFTQGIVFGEYWLATSINKRRGWLSVQIGIVVATVMAAKNMYRELSKEKKMNKVKEKKGVVELKR